MTRRARGSVPPAVLAAMQPPGKPFGTLDLAQRTGIERGTVGSTLGQLIELGCVERDPTTAGRREGRYWATGKPYPGPQSNANAPPGSQFNDTALRAALVVLDTITRRRRADPQPPTPEPQHE